MPKDYKKSKWTSDSFTVSWEDFDRVKITGPFEQTALIDGGDFESILSGICAAYNEGRRRGRVEN